MSKVVQFSYEGKPYQTVVFTPEELNQLKAGQMPAALLLQDMDGVHNPDMQSIFIKNANNKIDDRSLKAFIVQMKMVFFRGKPVTDPNDAPNHDFLLLNRPVLEHLGHIMQVLGLIPLLATQRLIYDPNDRRNAYFIKSAVESAKNLRDIPAFEHFDAEACYGVSEKLRGVLAEKAKRDKITLEDMHELAKEVHPKIHYPNDDRFSDYLKSILRAESQRESYPNPYDRFVVEALGKVVKALNAIHYFETVTQWYEDYKKIAEHCQSKKEAPDQETVLKLNNLFEKIVNAQLQIPGSVKNHKAVQERFNAAKAAVGNIKAYFAHITTCPAKIAREVFFQEAYMDFFLDRRGELMENPHFDEDDADKILANYIIYETNTSKAAIVKAWQAYLQEKGIPCDPKQYSLIDDHDSYEPHFDGAFVHKDMYKVLDNKETMPSPLDLLSHDLLDYHLIQLCLFRPPLIVISLLATAARYTNPIISEDVLAYQQEMAVNLLEHPVLDVALMAVLKDALQGEFKEKILDSLLEASKNLQDNPVFINRFVAQAFNWICQNLDLLPAGIAEMVRQAKEINANISHQFLLGRVFKAIFSNIKDIYPDLEQASVDLLEKIGKTFGLIGVTELTVLTLKLPADEVLFKHLQQMILTKESDIAPYFEKAASVNPISPAYESFKPNLAQEVMHLNQQSGFSNNEVYYKLFYYNDEDGSTVPLLVNSNFIRTDSDTGKITVLCAVSDGMVLSGSRSELSSDITGNISQSGIVTYRKTENKLVITSDFPIGVGRAVNAYQLDQAFRFDEALLPSGSVALSMFDDSGALGLMGLSIQKLLTNAKQSVDQLNLPKFIKSYLKVLLKVLFDFMTDPNSVDQMDALDALRIILYLKSISKKFKDLDIKGINKDIDNVFAGLSAGSGLLASRGNQRMIKIYIILWAAGVIAALMSNPSVPSENFELNYDIDVANFFRKYVLTALRGAIGLGYGSLGLVLMLSGLSLRDSFRSELARRKRPHDLQLIINQQGVHNPLGILREVLQRFSKHGKQQGLLELMDNLIANLQAGDGHWSQYKEGALVAALLPGAGQAPAPLSNFEKMLVYLTLRMKGIVIPLGLLPAHGYAIYRAIEAYNSPVIDDFSGDMLLYIMQLVALLAGNTGIQFFAAISIILFLLPEDILVRVKRGVESLFAWFGPTNDGAAPAESENRVRVFAGRNPAYRGAGHFGGNFGSALQEPLLEEDSKNTDDDAGNSMSPARLVFNGDDNA